MTDINERRTVLDKVKKITEKARQMAQKPKNLLLGTIMATSLNANAVENESPAVLKNEVTIEQFAGWSWLQNEDGSALITDQDGKQMMVDHMNLSKNKDFGIYVQNDTVKFIDSGRNTCEIKGINSFILGNHFMGVEKDNKETPDVTRTIRGDATDMIFAFKDKTGRVRFGMVDLKSENGLASVRIFNSGIKVTAAHKDQQLEIQKEGGFIDDVRTPQELDKITSRKLYFKASKDKTLNITPQMLAQTKTK